MSLLHLQQAAGSYGYVVPCMLKEAGTVKHQTICQAYARLFINMTKHQLQTIDCWCMYHTLQNLYAVPCSVSPLVQRSKQVPAAIVIKAQLCDMPYHA